MRMHHALTHLLLIGTTAIIVSVTAIGMLVYRELGPFSGLRREGKWMLCAALGMGVFAFTLKLGMALLIESAPEYFIHPLLTPTPRAADDHLTERVPQPHRPNLPAHYRWTALPLAPPMPDHPPPTPERVALGRRLFFEPKLSKDGSLSCASCHDLWAHAGADARPTAKGIAAQLGTRNTPTVWNAAFMSVQFWDGRAASLEKQAEGPILNPLEMGQHSPKAAEDRLNADGTYRADFQRAFGDEQPITFQRITQALAAFERTLVTADTPYDRYIRGDATALSPAQLRGMALFESVGCVLCHRGALFSDASALDGQNPFRIFPAHATPYDEKYSLRLPGSKQGVWRIPSLRNVALTGPWLHNGAVETLEEVVRIMASAQLGRTEKLTTWLDDTQILRQANRSPLTAQEVADIVAFLQSLSSDSLRASMALKSP